MKINSFIKAACIAMLLPVAFSCAIIIRDPLTNKKTDEWEVVLQTDNRLWIKFNLLPDHSENSLVKTIIKLNKK